MDAIYKIWINLWMPLSWPFTVAIFLLMVADLSTYYWNQGKDHRQFTGLMTGLGILGTFFGVVVGLQDFDPTNIGASIGPLLDGMKVSFVTSVAGLCAAIMTEIIQKAYPTLCAKSGDPVADSLSRYMIAFGELMTDAKKANQSVADNVAGMRTEMRDESVKVRQSLEEALDKLSKGATEEIIKALEDVIKDFNRNLTEQFGENFKQLNAACLKLVEWQATYKDSVDSAAAAVKSAQLAIDGSKEQLEAAVPLKERFYQIVQETGVSIKSLALLNDRLESLSGTQKQVLDSFSIAIADVQNKAVSLESAVNQAVTSVAAEQTKVINGFATLAENAEKGRGKIEQMLGEHARGHKLVSENIEEVVNRLGNSNNELQGHLGRALKELESSLTSLTRDFGSAYSKYLELMRTLVARGQ